jgi:Domain of unknown function (DUF4265)
MTDSDQAGYVMHEAPAWRPAEGYIAMVDLTSFGFPGLNEQIWLKQVGEARYEVRCVPFRAYGIALGDEVELHDGRSISRVVQSSGRRVLRIFFTNPRPSENGDDARGALTREVDSAGLLSEWSGDRHVAIDVPAGATMQGVYDSVTREIEIGSAVWEWADSEPFRYAGRAGAAE